ncbi:MAG: hypothetical protein AB8G99_21820 [Planctomycetaceae bacterium]
MSHIRPAAKRTSSNWIVVYAIGSSCFAFLLLGILIVGVLVRSSGPAQASEPQRTRLTQTGLIKAGNSSPDVVTTKTPAVAKPTPQHTPAVSLKQTLAAQKIAGLESHLMKLRGLLLQTEAEKAAHLSRIKAYALDHKAAIAAMGVTLGGVAVASDKKQRLTKDQKTAVGVATAVGGLYALMNGKECMEVADQMTKAAAIQSDYDSRIKNLKTQIANCRALIAKERTAIR